MVVSCYITTSLKISNIISEQFGNQIYVLVLDSLVSSSALMLMFSKDIIGLNIDVFIGLYYVSALSKCYKDN